MKIVKWIILEILLLAVLCFLGTVVMNVFDILFKLEYENIVVTGCKVGFASWLILLVIEVYLNSKGKNKK